MSTYLPVNKIAEEYGMPKRTVYNIVAEMKSCARYEGVWVTLDGGRRQLVNTLALEDYLRFRQRLRYRNLAKTLPPYSATEVLKQRGEQV